MYILVKMPALFISSVVLFLSFETGLCGYCDQHTIPFSGIVRDRTRFYLYGESFLVICDKGYRASVENGRFTCNKGVWSGHFPPCIPVDCTGTPPSMENGIIKSFSVQHLSEVVYECDDPYFPTTSDFKVQCLFGNWVGLPPVCKDSRCKFGDLPKREGVIPVNSLTNLTSSGERLEFVCNKGYNPTGITPLCTRGEWADYGSPYCREANCTTYDISHGSFMEPKQKRVWKWDTLRLQRTEVFKKVNIGLIKTPGTVLYIACQQWYTFKAGNSNGNTTICERGVWKPLPECKL